MTMNQTSRPTPAASQRRSDGDERVDMLALVFALLSGWRWIFAAVFLAATLGALVALSKVPVYQATGLLQLEQKQGALALPEGMQDLLGSAAGSSVNESETQMAIISSRLVIGQAVTKLGLQTHITPRRLPFLGMLPANLNLPDPELFKAYQWSRETITLGNLSVPEDWLNQTMLLKVIGPESYEITLPDGTVKQGQVKTALTLRDGAFSLTVAAIGAPAGREFEIGRLSLQEAVDRVKVNFTVSESSRNSAILRTSYRDSNKARAEAILDAIAESFVEQNVERNAASAESSLDFIDKQLPQARRNVADAEQALNTYREEQQSVDVDYETQALLERVTSIEGELSALDLKEAELKNQYTVNHPAYRALLQNRQELETQLAAARKATQSLPETQKDIFNLQRTLEVAQQVYLQLLNRSQELQVLRASTVGSVRIIDKAFASDIPVAPRKVQIVALGGLLGLIAGAALVLLRRAMRRGIRGAEEIEALGLPVFTTVPYAAAAANLREKRGNLPIFAQAHPTDVVTEALRSLRTSLHFGLLDAATNSIQITSPSPNVGKSFTAVNLAWVAAQAGQKVCLIDADMRRGYLCRFFNLSKKTPGLSDYLGHTKKLDEVMLPGPVDGLTFIPPGRYPPNPSELLMREEFSAMLDNLNEQFDLILIDSPPTLAVTDPVIIGRSVGATIAVVRHMETMAGELQALQASFDAAGGHVKGAVLNGFKASESARYSSRYHYHYNYRYSYKPEE